MKTIVAAIWVSVGLGLLPLACAADAAETARFLNAPASALAPAPKLAVQFELKLRLPEGRGLARLLINAGVKSDDAAGGSPPVSPVTWATDPAGASPRSRSRAICVGRLQCGARDAADRGRSDGHRAARQRSRDRLAGGHAQVPALNLTSERLAAENAVGE